MCQSKVRDKARNDLDLRAIPVGHRKTRGTEKRRMRKNQTNHSRILLKDETLKVLINVPVRPPSKYKKGGGAIHREIKAYFPVFLFDCRERVSRLNFSQTQNWL